MIFTLSTKPLSDALALGIVNANISNYHKKSCLAQVTASADTLTVNLETAFIVTELQLKGKGDSADTASVLVDSKILKQLISTIETSTISLEFTSDGLVVRSGKSRFTLPKMVDSDDLSLNKPSSLLNISDPLKIHKDNWKFIKDSQMYAISMAFIHPVYTKVWMGESGDVIVGDMDNSLFTHSRKGDLDTTCLLSDTIVNLFNSLPEGATLFRIDNGYQINASTDGFKMISEFTPLYEEDENVGSYNSDMILNMMSPDPNLSVDVNVSSLVKFLSQAELFSPSKDAEVHLSVHGGVLHLSDNNIDCQVDVVGSHDLSFELDFKLSLLKSVITNYTDETISMSFLSQGDEPVGIIVWTDDLCTVLAGVD